MTDVSDSMLVSEALNDLEAFGKLIDRYEEKLKRYILRISHFSPAEAEEILQEVFIKAWKNLRDFDQSLSFSSWIYRIAHNQTISQFRKAETRGDTAKVSIDDLYSLSTDELSLPEQTDQQLLAEDIQKTLNALSPAHRQVLVLRYFEDKSYEDISDILKKPMGTIATLVNRAKKAFKSTHLSLSPHTAS